MPVRLRLCGWFVTTSSIARVCACLPACVHVLCVCVCQVTGRGVISWVKLIDLVVWVRVSPQIANVGLAAAVSSDGCVRELVTQTDRKTNKTLWTTVNLQSVFYSCTSDCQGRTTGQQPSTSSLPLHIGKPIRLFSLVLMLTPKMRRFIEHFIPTVNALVCECLAAFM